MEAIQAYYDGNTFVPFVPVDMKLDQQVTVTITENPESIFPCLDDPTFWDGVYDTLMDVEERRLAGEPGYTHEEICAELEELYRAAKGA